MAMISHGFKSLVAKSFLGKAQALSGRGVAATLVSVSLFGSSALAANNEIKGFRYQTCGVGAKAETCIEVKAPKAWLTQTQKGSETSFSTGGLSELSILDANGKLKTKLTGTSATLHSEIRTISLDGEDGSTTLLSLDSGKLETIKGGQ